MIAIVEELKSHLKIWLWILVGGGLSAFANIVHLVLYASALIWEVSFTLALLFLLVGVREYYGHVSEIAEKLKLAKGIGEVEVNEIKYEDEMTLTDKISKLMDQAFEKEVILRFKGKEEFRKASKIIKSLVINVPRYLNLTIREDEEAMVIELRSK